MPKAVSLVVLSLGFATGACSGSDGFDFACNGATSFEAFQSGAPVSEIPMCTDAADASEPGSELEASPEIDAAFQPFAGARHLSVAGLKQCAAICTLASAPTPCCQSQWEPQTIVCAPPCS